MRRIDEKRDGDADWLVQVARDWLARAEGKEPLLDPAVPDNAEATKRAIRNLLASEGATEQVTTEGVADDDVLEAAIAAANDLYASDNIQIDARPAVSEADDGIWVAAWVWVDNDHFEGSDGAA